MSAGFDPLSGFSGRRVGYVRVSTPDQKIRSQTDWLESLHCERIFIDHGISGKHSERPALTDMLDYLESGDIVIVWRLDRLGRSVAHLAHLLNRFELENIHFCSVTEGINTTTAGGRLVFHIFAGIAEFNRNLIAENTVAGLEAAKARGVKLGRPPALSFEKATEAHQVITQFGECPKKIAQKLKISPATLGRTFKRYGFEAL